MASNGHAPTRGPGNKLYTLGLGRCPDCNSTLEGTECTGCGREFEIAGGADDAE